MASTNHFTSGLNNWAESDKPGRADFVHDNAILNEHAMWKKDYDPEGAILQEGGLTPALVKIHAALNEKANLYRRNTDERVVGYDLDGKPLYEKTILCGALPNNGSKLIPHGIENGLHIRVAHDSFAALSPASCATIPLPFVATGAGYSIQVAPYEADVRIITTDNWSAQQYSEVVLRYKKTTD